MKKVVTTEHQKSGLTPLLCSINGGHFGIALNLLAANADARVTSRSSTGPLHLAALIAPDQVQGYTAHFAQQATVVGGTGAHRLVHTLARGAAWSKKQAKSGANKALSAVRGSREPDEVEEVFSDPETAEEKSSSLRSGFSFRLPGDDTPAILKIRKLLLLQENNQAKVILFSATAPTSIVSEWRLNVVRSWYYASQKNADAAIECLSQALNARKTAKKRNSLLYAILYSDALHLLIGDHYYSDVSALLGRHGLEVVDSATAQEISMSFEPYSFFDCIRATLKFRSFIATMTPGPLIRTSSTSAPVEQYVHFLWLLRARGAYIGPDVSGETPLHYAAKAGNVIAIRVLLSLGAQLDRQSALVRQTATVAFWTALHYAAKGGHVGCIFSLVRAGASLDNQARVSASEHYTPLQVAVKFQHPRAARLLGLALITRMPGFHGCISPALAEERLHGASAHHQCLLIRLSSNFDRLVISFRLEKKCSHMRIRITDFACIPYENKEYEIMDFFQKIYRKYPMLENREVMERISLAIGICSFLNHRDFCERTSIKSPVHSPTSSPIPVHRLKPTPNQSPINRRSVPVVPLRNSSSASVANNPKVPFSLSSAKPSDRPMSVATPLTSTTTRNVESSSVRGIKSNLMASDSSSVRENRYALAPATPNQSSASKFVVENFTKILTGPGSTELKQCEFFHGLLSHEEVEQRLRCPQSATNLYLLRGTRAGDGLALSLKWQGEPDITHVKVWIQSSKWFCVQDNKEIAFSSLRELSNSFTRSMASLSISDYLVAELSNFTNAPFHGTLDSNGASLLLKGQPFGSWLLRQSPSQKSIVLVQSVPDNIIHSVIKPDFLSGGFSIEDQHGVNRTFGTVVELVAGFPAQLRVFPSTQGKEKNKALPLRRGVLVSNNLNEHERSATFSGRPRQQPARRAAIADVFGKKNDNRVPEQQNYLLCYAPLLNRQGAERLLLSPGTENMDFIVRSSSFETAQFALSARFETEVIHVLLHSEERRGKIVWSGRVSEEVRLFDSLVDAVAAVSSGGTRSAPQADRVKLVATLFHDIFNTWPEPLPEPTATDAGNSSSGGFMSLASGEVLETRDDLSLTMSSSNNNNKKYLNLQELLSPRYDTPVVQKKEEMHSRHVIQSSELAKKKILGAGNFGQVWQGDWNGVKVAIKEVTSVDSTAKNQLLIEAQRFVSLRPHPNVINFYGITHDPLSIVIEFCPGGALDEALYGQRPRSFSLSELMHIAHGIVLGVSHLHRQDVIHRDLAARNILLGLGDVPKVVDFGMSRQQVVDDQITVTTIGPIKWMAPEQLTNQVVSKSADVWALGVVFYEIFAQQRPWFNLTNVEVAHKVISGGSLSVPDDAPPVIVDAMRGCFQSVPGRRPTTIELADLLDDASSSSTISSFQSSRDSYQFFQSPKEPVARANLIDDGYVEPPKRK